MNSLLNNQNQNQIINNQRVPSFSEFASMWTPQAAKQEIERMIQAGMVSQEQVEKIKNQIRSDS